MLNETEEKMVKKHLVDYFTQRKITSLDNLLMHAERVKYFLEKTIYNFPKIPISDYKIYMGEMCFEKKFATTIDTDDIKALIAEKQGRFQLSLLEAKKLLEHSVFRIDSRGKNVRAVSNGKLLPGLIPLSVYEDALSKHDYKGKTMWDVFKDGILTAVPVYSPHRSETVFHRNNICYLNTFIPASWKEENLIPLEYKDLDPILRAYLEHLFPDPQVRKHALKWSAYSTHKNLQTYLTLIGLPGIGKTIFVSDFLAYYHGYNNYNIITKIENLVHKKESFGTLYYFDELMMNSMTQYNILKKLTNDLVGFDFAGPEENFANVVWSSNTKEGMRALRRDDRRFKILPVSEFPLCSQIKTIQRDGTSFAFTTENINSFKNDVSLKKQLVAHFLHILEKQESIDDINSVQNSLTREQILLESRSEPFKEVYNLLFNIKNDYIEVDGVLKVLNPNSPEMKRFGVPFEDYVPLSALIPSPHKQFTLRYPGSIIKKIIDIKKAKEFCKINYFSFRKELAELPSNYVKTGFTAGADAYHVDLFISNFDPEMRALIQRFVVSRNKVRGKVAKKFLGAVNNAFESPLKNF